MKTIGKYAFSALVAGLAVGSALSANAWTHKSLHDVSSTRPRGSMNMNSHGSTGANGTMSGYGNGSGSTNSGSMSGYGDSNGSSGAGTGGNMR